MNIGWQLRAHHPGLLPWLPPLLPFGKVKFKESETHLSELPWLDLPLVLTSSKLILFPTYQSARKPKKTARNTNSFKTRFGGFRISPPWQRFLTESQIQGSDWGLSLRQLCCMEKVDFASHNWLTPTLGSPEANPSMRIEVKAVRKCLQEKPAEMKGEWDQERKGPSKVWCRHHPQSPAEGTLAPPCRGLWRQLRCPSRTGRVEYLHCPSYQPLVNHWSRADPRRQNS